MLHRDPRPSPAAHPELSAPAGASVVQLRRAALAVSVLTDLDLLPGDDAVLLPGRDDDLEVGWDEVRLALGPGDPESPAARERLSRWLHTRRRAADLPPAVLETRLRPLGLPVGHVLHPGPGWPVERVLGEALDLGLGAVGLDPVAPDRVDALPASALPQGEARARWAGLRRDLDGLGAVAASRAGLDASARLRPAGDCDVVTLLGARTLRASLAAGAGGMATVVVPMRTRGWTRLALVDPAFGVAAAAATAPADRGFPRPVLVTADEVVLPRDGGAPEQLALRQGAAAGGWSRDVRYR